MKRCIIPCIFLLLIAKAFTQNFEFVSFADYYGGIEPSKGYENLRTRIYMHPKFYGMDMNSGLEWQLAANLWVQPLGKPFNIDPWNILGETYLLLPFNTFEIIVGQKIITYGFADIRGPLNIVNSTFRSPYSLDDSFDAFRPNPLMQLKVFPSFEDTLEFTYVPISRPDKERLDPIDLPGSGDTLNWEPDSYITDNLHSFFFNYNRYGEKLDMQIFYGYHINSTPDFTVNETSSKTVSIIHPEYNRKHTLGFAYSTRIGNATLSQDIALGLTNNLNGTAIGGQYSDITLNNQLLLNLPWNILSQHSLVASYFFNYENYTAGTESDAASYLSEQFRIFHTQPRQFIAYYIGHFEKAFLREKLKTTLNLGFFFSPEIYFGPRISYAVTDHWQVELGLDITLGNPPNDDLRRNNSNDNFYFRVLFRY